MRFRLLAIAICLMMALGSAQMYPWGNFNEQGYYDPAYNSYQGPNWSTWQPAFDTYGSYSMPPSYAMPMDWGIYNWAWNNPLGYATTNWGTYLPMVGSGY